MSLSSKSNFAKVACVLAATSGFAPSKAAPNAPRVLASKTSRVPIRIKVENGWLTASRGSAALLSRGAGFPVDVTIDNTPLLEGENLTASTRGNTGGSWETRYVAARGEVIERFAPFPALGNHAWRRSLLYTNRSEKSQDLTEAVLRLAPCEYSHLWNPDWFWMAQSAGGAVHVAYQGTTDFYSLVQTRSGIESRVQAAWRLKPGQSAQIGAQGVWLTPNGAANFRDEAQRWYQAIGLRVAPHKPAWLSRSVWYEASAGGGVESRFSDVGGFAAFSHQLDYLADLGVNTIWLNAVHAHKSPPNPKQGGWNHYDPIDFSKIDEVSGGENALRNLTRAMRKRGVHVIGELVPHGGRSVQANALPQWWTGGRDGKPLKTWGGNTMDLSSPLWQDVMRGASTRLARDFDTEGLRVDVADGQGPNWTSPRTNHSSYSTLGGSLEMLRAMKGGLQRGGVSQPVLLPESGFDRPEHFSITPLGYGWQTTTLFANGLPSDLSDAAEMVRRLRAFFEKERGSLPSGALVLRTLNNHDTVVERGRTMQRFGAGLSRALYGVCVAVPGVPMLYQEEEVGSFEALRKLNFARRRVPEMGDGAPDYTSVTFAPEVFCVLRTLHSSRASTRALALVNLSGKTVSGRVTLAANAKLRNGAPVFDAVSGRRAKLWQSGFAWKLAPYETSVLRFGKAPEGATPPLRFRGETANTTSRGASETKTASAPQVAPDTKNEIAESEVSWRIGTLRAHFKLPQSDASTRWQIARAGNATRFRSSLGEISLRRNGAATQVEMALKDGAPPPEIEIVGVGEWAVSGRTAWLQDRLLRRHFPFPKASHYDWNRAMIWGAAPWDTLYRQMLPVGRLWQSVLEPLHPAASGFVFAGENRDALVFSQVKSNARNIVLTDRSDEIEDASTRTYGLALRFYADDPELHPRVSAFGADAKQWRMENYPTRAAEDLRISFRVEAARSEAPIGKLRDALRLPLARSSVREERSSGSFTDFFEATWLMQPGTISWNGLAAANGVYRIGLELRSSEISAEGRDLEGAYTVFIDGIAQPLSWMQRNIANTGNAYFGLALTPPLDLSGKTHTIKVVTSKPWEAVRTRFRLVAP